MSDLVPKWEQIHEFFRSDFSKCWLTSLHFISWTSIKKNYRKLGASPWRHGVTAALRLLTAIGVNLVDPHSGPQVSNCRDFGAPISSSDNPVYATTRRHRSEAGSSPLWPPGQ